MISVAMTVYNGEDYLEEQLISILNQTRMVDEIIIVNDNSTDRSAEILKRFEERYPNIHVFNNSKNVGYKKNFQKAVSLCHGELVFLCDQDDIWFEDKVSVLSKLLEENEDMTVIASSFEFMDQLGTTYKVKPRKGMSNNNMYLKDVGDGSLVPVTFEEFCLHNYFQGCSMAMKRNIAERFVDSFTDLLPHDWLIAMLSSYEKGFYFYNVPLFKYRMHPKNTIGVPKGNKNEEWVRILYAEDLNSAMKAVKLLFPQYWNEHSECNQRLKFSSEHIQAIKHRDILNLIKQNKNPMYRELKSPRARVMDLIFAITHKYR